MGRAGLAMAAGEPGEGRVGPILDLVEQGHPQTVAWALRAAHLLTAEETRAVRLATLEAARARGASAQALYALATEAAASLADNDPALLEARLSAAMHEGDARLAEALLAGALRSTNPAAGTLAEGREWPQGTLAALAALVAARHGIYEEGVDGAESRNLAAVALGRGMLPDAFRLQAAWLAIKGSGQEQIVIARVLAEAGE
jgi:hypothetical protein